MTDFPPRYEPATSPAAADQRAGQADPRAGQAHARAGEAYVRPDEAYPQAGRTDPGVLTRRQWPGLPPLEAETGPVPRIRHTRPVILLGAVAAVLLAGLAWWIVTGPGRPGPASPAGGTPPAARPLSAAQQAQYQVTRVRAVARPSGVDVRWSPPSRTADVAAFIVVAEVGGQAQQERTVGSAGHSAVFAELRPGRRYCFVVGTVIELANGQAGTTTTPRVCKVTR